MNVNDAIKVAQDPRRLDVLREYNLLDTEVEESFDRLTRLASKITDSPISLVSLVDADRQFFKSLIGLPKKVAEARETPLSHSFCKHVVEDQSPLIVKDAREHPILKDNLAVPELGVVSYLGMPLNTPSGTCLGSFCVIDTKPRKWSEREIEIVRELALSVMAEIELRAQVETRKRVEMDLRLSEAHKQSIIDSALDAVIVINSQSEITKWNDQAAQIFGWSQEEALGRTLVETIIPPAFRETHVAAVKHHQQTGEGPILNQRIEITAQHRDGHEFPVELTVSPLSMGTRTIYSAFVRDITDQKAREAELQQAKEQAEQATLAKSTFLANMSHEIRTPLNSIIGLTSLLLDSELAGTQAEYVQTVNRSGRTLLEIINNILDFSKLEAGMMELERLPFSLKILLAETCDLMSSQAQEKNLTLSYDIFPGTPVALAGDVTRLRQILINLINNGIKFTEQGGVSIYLNSTKVSDMLEEFHFQVKDSGAGIAQEHQEQLFQSFTQVDASTTRKYGGTGLGLAICQDLVEIMDGRIWVESELGRGSTFHFSVKLPLVIPLELPKIKEKKGIDQEMGRKHPLQILVAEDDAVNQLVSLRMLERLGYQADVVDDGLEVLRVLRRQPYDLVLMDVQMPEMDGVEATQVIHNEWSLSERPYIIALTANAMAGDREHYLGLGMDGYLAKPLLMEPLIEALQEALVGLGKDQSPEISVINRGHVPTAQDLEPIDQAAFLDRLGVGSEALLYQLVTMFLEEEDQDLAIFKQGLADNDRDAVQASIHKLKGSSSTASAHIFATYCQEILELLAQDADLAVVAAYLPRLNQALAAVQQWQQEHAPDN